MQYFICEITEHAVFNRRNNRHKMFTRKNIYINFNKSNDNTMFTYRNNNA